MATALVNGHQWNNEIWRLIILTPVNRSPNTPLYLCWPEAPFQSVIGGSSQAAAWNEARKAEVWCPKGWERDKLGFLGPPRQLRGLGSAVSSPSGVRGEVTGKCGFGTSQGLKNQVISTFHSWFCRLYSLWRCAKDYIIQLLGVRRPSSTPKWRPWSWPMTD